MNPDAIGEAAVRGVRWLAIMRVISESVGLGAAIALARLVSPAEFGRAAVALLFVTLSVLLTFEGFASALVQRPTVGEDDRRAAMLLSIVGGSALCLVVYFAPIWQPLFGARTATLIRLASPAMLLAAFGGVSRATVWRRLDFRRISTIDVASLLVGSAASVALALAGLGAKAIVVGGLAQVATTTILLIASAPPPRPGWSRESQRRIAVFGTPAALAAFVDTLFRNVDYAILAARLPAAQAGFYYRAFNVGVVYQDKLSSIMMQIGFPLYSRVGDHGQLRRLHERAARLHAVIIFPMLASLMVLAPVVVPLVFGSAWRPAVVPTQILAVAGMVAAILTGYPQLMLAIGRPGALLRFNLTMLIAYAAAVLVASRHGLVTVSIVVSVVYLTILVGVYRSLLQRYVGISIRRLIPELGPAVIGCLALVAVALPLSHVVTPTLPRLVTVAVVAPTGLIVYGLVLRAGFPSAWRDLTALLTRVVPVLGQRRRGARLGAEAVAP